MAECPGSIEEYLELERLIPLCRDTVFNQAKARIESGAAKSVSEAARQLAEETGRSVEGIRTALKRAIGTGSVNQLSSIANTSKHAPNRPPADHLQFEKPNDTVAINNNSQLTNDHETDLVTIPLLAVDETTATDDDASFDEPYKHIEPEKKKNHRAIGTGENEWYTPAQYIEMAKTVFAGVIETDPASSWKAQEVVNAERYFDLESDGLSKEWNGKVWLNPPYAQPAIRLFIEKAVSEFGSGRITEMIILTHNYTDTSWFHTASSVCSAVCFPRGRIAFVSPDGKKAAPTQGQTFFYYGGGVDNFFSVFSKIGIVLVKK